MTIHRSADALGRTGYDCPESAYGWHGSPDRAGHCPWCRRRVGAPARRPSQFDGPSELTDAYGYAYDPDHGVDRPDRTPRGSEFTGSTTCDIIGSSPARDRDSNSGPGPALPGREMRTIMARGSAPSQLNSAITEVAGKKIIATEPAVGRHPHPGQNGRVVPITGVSKVLLEDNTETHVCNACGWAHPDVKSVTSHMPAHTLNRNLRRYAPDVARVVVRLVREAEREHGRRSKCEVAARRLNERGLTTLNGARWHAQDVSRVYRSYKDAYPTVGKRARVARSTLDTTTPASATSPESTQTTSPTTGQKIADELWLLIADHDALGARLAELHRVVAHLPTPKPVDPEIVEKARRWDAVRGLMGQD